MNILELFCAFNCMQYIDAVQQFLFFWRAVFSRLQFPCASYTFYISRIKQVGGFVFIFCASRIDMFTDTGIATPFGELIPLHFCHIVNFSSKHIYSFWIPLLCFDTILLVLAIHKGYDSLIRYFYNRNSERRVGVLDVLVKNSLIYYIM